MEFLFTHFCNFRIDQKNLDVEKIELEFIDFGVEEVFVADNEINLYASFEHYGKIQKELENRNLKILFSGFERIPQLVNALEYEQKNEVLELIEKIEEDDDVQNVYHTLDIKNI